VDGKSCVRKCEEKESIGSFGKCYKSCDYPNTNIGTTIHESCETSCLLTFIFGCSNELCVFVSSEIPKCELVRASCTDIMDSGELCETPGIVIDGLPCVWVENDDPGKSECLTEVCP
jgi:hypothetical protein